MTVRLKALQAIETSIPGIITDADSGKPVARNQILKVVKGAEFDAPDDHAAWLLGLENADGKLVDKIA